MFRLTCAAGDFSCCQVGRLLVCRAQTCSWYLTGAQMIADDTDTHVSFYVARHCTSTLWSGSVPRCAWCVTMARNLISSDKIRVEASTNLFATGGEKVKESIFFYINAVYCQLHIKHSTRFLLKDNKSVESLHWGWRSLPREVVTNTHLCQRGHADWWAQLETEESCSSGAGSVRRAVLRSARRAEIEPPWGPFTRDTWRWCVQVCDEQSQPKTTTKKKVKPLHKEPKEPKDKVLNEITFIQFHELTNLDLIGTLYCGTISAS